MLWIFTFTAARIESGLILAGQLRGKPLAMRVAFGLKAHSGWAALVVLGAGGAGYRVVDRRRIELVDAETARWAAQPYHAAQGREPDQARDIVNRGIEAARRAAVREMQAAMERSRPLNHEIVACAVVMPEPMPNWSPEQILSVHFRMHKAEGVLFPDALARAALACGLPLAVAREKTLLEEAEKALASTRSDLMTTIAALGKAAGPPWGKDQKCAALAAMIALANCLS
jgi:hypothetical protein